MSEIYKQAIYNGKEIEGYEISNEGNLRNKETGLIRKPHLDKGGYLRVTIMRMKNGKRYTKTIGLHRCVACTFCENTDPVNQTVVDHYNNNKQDNKDTNLHWVTPQYNSKKAAEDGLYSDQNGCNNSNTKFTKEDILNIRRLYKEGKSIQEIADMYNVAHSTIYNIVTYKRYKFD